MKTSFTRIPACLVSIAAVAIAGCSSESFHHGMHQKPSSQHPPQAQAAGHAAASKATTYSIQDDSGNWKRSPEIHAFYDTTVATFANGTNIDVDAYEAKSFAIFREMARANGWSEPAMIDHLKLIPRQVVGIVKENPDVLKSFDAFWIAMVGPD